jgi:hypothetical protein
VLFNSETWQGLKESDITKLNIIDHQLLRFICNSHAKTPVEFLYLETGAIPLSFIISSRRLNYLHTIVTREDEELTKRVYLAQKSNPSPGDFVKLIENDFKTIGEEMNENFVRNMGKEQFKIFVKNKIKEATLKYLQDKQAGHS